jgi:hypothetical protein
VEQQNSRDDLFAHALSSAAQGRSCGLRRKAKRFAMAEEYIPAPIVCAPPRTACALHIGLRQRRLSKWSVARQRYRDGAATLRSLMGACERCRAVPPQRSLLVQIVPASVNALVIDVVGFSFFGNVTLNGLPRSGKEKLPSPSQIGRLATNRHLPSKSRVPDNSAKKWFRQ